MAGESIHHLEVSLAVDAAGVRRGFQTAAQEARHFKLQLEKESYKAEKLVPKQYGPNPTAEFLKQRKQSEESFKTWYKGALEEEYKDWYQKEQKKQTQLQQFLINETNVRNAARFQQQPEAETLARAKENDDLESAIRQRYQILDQEAHREMRLNRARELDAKKAAKDSRNDQLHELRRQESLRQQAIRDGGIQELNQRKAISEGVIRQIRRQEARARDARVRVTDQDLQRQQDQDIGDASRIINRNRTATELYTQALGRLDHIYHTVNTTTGRALLTDQEYGKEKTRLIIATIRQQQAQTQANNTMLQGADNARIMTGVLGQASFAAEDFIQGVAFGDLRAALLGASNNLTMVGRGLLQIGKNSTGLGKTLAGVWGWLIGIPAAGVAMVAAWRWVHFAEMDVRSLSDALTSAGIGLKRFDVAATLAQNQRTFDIRIKSVKTVESAEQMILQLKDQQKTKEEELANITRKNAIEAQEFVNNQLGGVEARIELDRMINKTIHGKDATGQNLGTDTQIAAAHRLKVLMAEMNQNAQQGNQKTIHNLREMYQILNNSFNLVNSTGLLFDITALDALEETFQTSSMFAGESQERLDEIRKQLEDTQSTLTQAQKEQLQIEEQLIELFIEKNKLIDKEAEARGKAMEDALQQNQWRQEEVLFMMRATDEQKAQLELLKEIGGFLGEGGLADLGQNLGVNALAEEFLKAKAAQIEKDMLANIPGAAGGLEQNAFNAQAKAFEQMQKKPDQTLKKQLDELKAINQALGQLNDKQNIELVGVP